MTEKIDVEWTADVQLSDASTIDGRTSGDLDTPQSEALDLPVHLDRLASQLESLAKAVAEDHHRAAARERVIDRLHDENQRLRVGERQFLLRPVLSDIGRLRNEMLRQVRGMPEQITADQASGLLESFAYSLEQAMERCGVRPIEVARGELFDSRRHRALDVVPAPSPDRDETIARVIDAGYLDATDERVLTPASVVVHRWTPGTAATSWSRSKSRSSEIPP